MKRHYLSLWLLLATAFAIFAVASTLDMPEIAGHRLKSSEIVPSLLAAGTEELPEITDSIFPDSVMMAVAEDIFPVECDTTAQTILFIGDSMLEGLAPRLAAYCEHNGHELYTVVWYSSTSEIWGGSDKLRSYIDRVKPSYVIICLGANELFVTDIERKRDKHVRKILADIDTIPYLWIGPPNWKPDTGINNLIARNARRGTFFLSDGMSFERSKDGAHPTRKSASQWLDSVVRWMPANSAHPIRLDAPDKDSGRPRRTFVHQPDER